MAKMRTGTCPKCGLAVVASHCLVEQVWDSARGVDVLQHKAYGCDEARRAVAASSPSRRPIDRPIVAPVAAPARATCRRCGGPVSDGRAVCGEC